MLTMSKIEEAKTIIKTKGSGIHPIEKNLYAFGEPWDYECINPFCGHITDDHKFKKCAYDHIEKVTMLDIPSELKQKGYKIIEISHIEFDGDDIPFGWTIAVIQK